MAPSTCIQQYGAIASQPSDTYGEGEVILRIGNGGAGATGLLVALSTDYLSQTNTPGSIQWICNHSRNTQLALLHGYIDIALTYEREQEDIAVVEGWAQNHGCIFHDHFCLAGPVDDPANIRSATDVIEVLHRIATSHSTFHSRADGSATMWKERGFWLRTHLRPWDDSPTHSTPTTISPTSSLAYAQENKPGNPNWYKQLPCTPAEALARANSDGAYLLCDRSTFLTQFSRGLVSDLTIFHEPTGPWHEMMNSCYALTRPGFGGHVVAFIEYLRSDRGQGIIARYGRDRVGISLFAPVAEGYAKEGLVGVGGFNGGVGRGEVKL